MQHSAPPISITTYNVKPPTLSKVTCDDPIHPKLDNHPLWKTCNRSFFALVLGRPGTGKSTFIKQALIDKRMLNKCFERVYIVIPENSMQSFGENNKLAELPDDQIYNHLTLPILREIYDKVKENRENGWRSLIIFDDVQGQLKGACEKLLLEMAANRRHQRLSMIITAQNYKRVPRDVRLVASDVFSFNMSNGNYNIMYQEVINLDKPHFDAVIDTYKHFLKDTKKKSFLYFNLEANVIFIDWNHQLSSDLF